MSDTLARVAKWIKELDCNSSIVSSSLTARSNFNVTQTVSWRFLSFKGGDSHLASQFLTSALELHFIEPTISAEGEFWFIVPNSAFIAKFQKGGAG